MKCASSLYILPPRQTQTVIITWIHLHYTTSQILGYSSGSPGFMVVVVVVEKGVLVLPDFSARQTFPFSTTNIMSKVP